MEDLLVSLEKLESEMKALLGRVQVTDEALKHMAAIYEVAFIESSYDPYNERSRETAALVWPHIKALNDVYGFKK